MDENNTQPKNIYAILSSYLGLKPIDTPKTGLKIYDGFLFPIEYLDKTQIHYLTPEVLSDLELCVGSATCEKDENTALNPSMYHYYCSPNTPFTTEIIPDIARIYTTNIDYLKDTQSVVKNMSEFQPGLITAPSAEQFREVWNEIKEDATFLEKHSFMEYTTFEELNHSHVFLQGYSMLNILSPIFSIATPLFMLILPFLLIKLQGHALTTAQYIETLKEIARNHVIGKMLNMKSFSFETGGFFLLTFCLWLLQMYGNTMACIRYYKTVRRMNENILYIREYIGQSIQLMDKFVSLNDKYSHYKDFCHDIRENREVLNDIYMDLNNPSYKATAFRISPHKLLEIGYMLKCYYRIYSDIGVEEALRYSVGLHGYLHILNGIYTNWNRGYLGACEYMIQEKDTQPEKEEDDTMEKEDDIKDEENDTDQSEEAPAEEDEQEQPPKKPAPATIFHGQYYPALIQSKNVVINECSLSTNVIITGVNASGKTTTLKTTAINIICSQQYGYGFYDTATVIPYHHIHSYLNIPDTSGRDSLFQAESRRCKHIIDKIRTTPDSDRHFCLFDELYSGTNPKEAVKSAYSLLRYLAGHKNVSFILTTHYVPLCEQVEEITNITNYQMVVERDESNKLVYTYKMAPGISTEEGGIEILKNMDYPKEILDNIV